MGFKVAVSFGFFFLSLTASAGEPKGLNRRGFLRNNMGLGCAFLANALVPDLSLGLGLPTSRPTREALKTLVGGIRSHFGGASTGFVELMRGTNAAVRAGGSPVALLTEFQGSLTHLLATNGVRTVENLAPSVRHHLQGALFQRIPSPTQMIPLARPPVPLIHSSWSSPSQWHATQNRNLRPTPLLPQETAAAMEWSSGVGSHINEEVLRRNLEVPDTGSTLESPRQAGLQNLILNLDNALKKQPQQEQGLAIYSCPSLESSPTEGSFTEPVFLDGHFSWENALASFEARPYQGNVLWRIRIHPGARILYLPRGTRENPPDVLLNRAGIIRIVSTQELNGFIFQDVEYTEK